MKFLVTGGAGYIGSHMVKYLQDKNFEVEVIDNFSTGNKWSLKNCLIYEIDLLDKNALDNIISHNNYDAVFHFAAKSVVSDSFIFEQEYMDNNVIASSNLLESMIRHGVNNIIFSSSASVFGYSNSLKIDETHSKLPVSPYGKTKLLFEKILFEKCKSSKINAAILRYFNAAGADKGGLIGEFHDPETHLIPSIFNNFYNNEITLRVFGDDHNTRDGTCVRDFVHVSDLVHAHYLALKKIIIDRGCFDYNLGNGNGFSILEIIRLCESIAKKKANFKFVNKRNGEPEHLVADSSKAKLELNWKTENSDINEIIKTAWKWHLRLYSEII